MDIQGVSSNLSSFAVPAVEPKPTPPPAVNQVPAVSNAGQTQTQVDYRMDQEANQLIISIVDGNSGRTVTQIPPETSLSIIRHMNEMLQKLSME